MTPKSLDQIRDELAVKRHSGVRDGKSDFEAGFDAAIAHLQSMKGGEDFIWVRWSRCTGNMSVHASEAEVFKNIKPNNNYEKYIHESALLAERARAMKLREAIMEAQSLVTVSSRHGDFEKLRMMKFESFSVHDIDTAYVILTEALRAYDEGEQKERGEG